MIRKDCFTPEWVDNLSERYNYRDKTIKTTSLAGGLSTAYKAAVTSLSLKGPLIKI